MIHFRPQIFPTVFVVGALVILCGLGNWQLDRRAWKIALIEEVQSRSLQAPIDYSRALNRFKSGDAVEYTPATVSGEFRHEREIHLFRQNVGGKGGYHVITPLEMENGQFVLVNRGYVPPERRDPESRLEGQIEGRQTITGLVRADGQPGYFVPANNPEKEEWFFLDHQAMASAAGLSDVLPLFLEANDVSVPGGYPKGGQTRVTFKNDHLGYALTWFGLAIVLVGVYIAHQVSLGRILVSFGRDQ